MLTSHKIDQPAPLQHSNNIKITNPFSELQHEPSSALKGLGRKPAVPLLKVPESKSSSTVGISSLAAIGSLNLMLDCKGNLYQRVAQFPIHLVSNDEGAYHSGVMAPLNSQAIDTEINASKFLSSKMFISSDCQTDLTGSMISPVNSGSASPVETVDCTVQTVSNFNQTNSSDSTSTSEISDNDSEPNTHLPIKRAKIEHSVHASNEASSSHKVVNNFPLISPTVLPPTKIEHAVHASNEAASNHYIVNNFPLISPTVLPPTKTYSNVNKQVSLISSTVPNGLSNLQKIVASENIKPQKRKSLLPRKVPQSEAVPTSNTPTPQMSRIDTIANELHKKQLVVKPIEQNIIEEKGAKRPLPNIKVVIKPIGSNVSAPVRQTRRNSSKNVLTDLPQIKFADKKMPRIVPLSNSSIMNGSINSGVENIIAPPNSNASHVSNAVAMPRRQSIRKSSSSAPCNATCCTTSSTKTTTNPPKRRGRPPKSPQISVNA